jgi:hypothetical protein
MTEEKKEPRIDYSQSGQEIAHADFVRLVSSPTGFLFIFAQNHPDRKDEVLCIKQMTIPPLVAGQVLAILTDQVSKWEKLNKQKITPDELTLEVETKKQ